MMKKLFLNLNNHFIIISLLSLIYVISFVNNEIYINLIILLIIIISFIILLKPIFGILIMLAISPFLSLPENPLLNKLFLIYVFIYFLTIFSFIIKIIFKNIKLDFNLSFMFPIFALFYSLFISFFTSLNNNVNLLDWLRRVFPFSILILSFVIYFEIKDNNKNFKILLYSILLLTIFNSFKIFYLWLININKLNQVYLYTDIRASWYGRNGISLITSSFLIFYLLLVNKNKNYDKFYQILFLLSIISIIITFTRTYWFSIPLSYFFIILFIEKKYHNKIKKLFFKQFIYLSLILLILLIISPSLINKFIYWILNRIKAIEPSQINLSTLNRIDEIRFLIPYILKKPIFGYGLGSSYFMYSVNPFSDRGIGWVLTSYSHNFYLYHLYSTGFLGLLIWIYFVFYFIYKGIKIYKEKRIILSIIISGIFFGIFISSFLFPEYNDKLTNLLNAILIGFLGYFENLKVEKELNP